MSSIDLFINSFKKYIDHKNTAFLLAIILFILNFTSDLAFQYIKGWNIGMLPRGLLFTAIIIGFTTITSIVSLTWHRQILLGEKFILSIKTLNPIFKKYIIGVLSITPLYILFIFIYMIGVNIIFATAMNFAPSTLRSFITISVLLLSLFYGLTLLFRVTLTLPPRAINETLSIENALKFTQNKNWLIFGYLVISFLVNAIVLFPLSIHLQPDSILHQPIWSVAYIAFIKAVFSLAHITALALLYKNLITNTESMA